MSLFINPSSVIHALTLAIVVSLSAPSSFAETALDYTILEKQPHDPKIFTQGFYIEDNMSYESSGLFGRSFVRVYETETRQIYAEKELPHNIFAEGYTLFNDHLYLLTWKSEQALLLNPKTLELISQYSYAGEGWGITHTDKELITSDGSHNLYFRNPNTFNITRSISVHNAWRRYKHLNELEFAQSAIWANVWQSDLILKISPKDGQVLGVANFKALAKENRSYNKQQNVLNGIAYDKQRDAFWITGKFWPYQYLIKFKTKHEQR